MLQYPFMEVDRETQDPTSSPAPPAAGAPAGPSTSACLQDVAEKTAVLGSQGIASAPGVVALGAGVVVGALVGVCAAACEHSRRRHAALAALAALAARV